MVIVFSLLIADNLNMHSSIIYLSRSPACKANLFYPCSHVKMYFKTDFTNSALNINLLGYIS